MRKGIQYAVCVLMAALFLGGCSMRTVDQMYRLPKRSEEYSNLQSVIDKAMAGLEFSAPLAGDNQQSVQMADVDGDGEQEYLVFAKSSSQLPLRILVFDRAEEELVHADTIECSGAAFDQVEYVQMDKTPGVEVVIGCRVSDQLVRSVAVYTFAGGEAEQLVSANYRNFITVDMDADGMRELFVLRPGEAENDRGVAELYTMKSGIVERSNEVSMSGPVDKLKRILVGKLHDGYTAVYVASTVDDTALITDVYAQVGGLLTNVSLSKESGTSVQTLRNYYVYADDMDNDGVIELPSLVTMIPMENMSGTEPRDLIRWYTMGSDGSIVNKLYTYYDSVGGWYLELEESIAPRMTVRCQSNIYEFYQWNGDYSAAQKLMTVYMLTGQNREEQSLADGRFVLTKTDSVTYAATLEAAAAEYSITQESLIRSFYLIHRDWNTGEM